MTDTTKCPKCSAERKPHWTGWECGSSQFTHGQEFTQSLGCRIAELTQQLAEVTAERDSAKKLHYDTNTSLLESQASHEYTLSLLTAARAELAEVTAERDGVTEIYNAGFAAHRGGAERSGNPHADSSLSGKAWDAGWLLGSARLMSFARWRQYCDERHSHAATKAELAECKAKLAEATQQASIRTHGRAAGPIRNGNTSRH